jgi:hypothetical protein
MGLLVSLTPADLSASPVGCDTVIAGHIAWLGHDYPHRSIGAKFTRVKITSTAEAPQGTRWGHISVAEGGFGWHGTEMIGRFMVAFSDRRDASGRGFDPAQRDITDITLYADGRGELLLRSWGDARIVLSEMRCDTGGFLTAIEREANGASMITLSFRRETL